MRARMLMAVFGLAALPGAAQAQSEWLAENGTGVAVEMRHPVWVMEPDDASMLNGAFFVSGRFALPVVGLAAVAELPLGYGKIADESNFKLGNVYLGVEMPMMLGLVRVEGGVRLPTLGDLDADDVGGFVAASASMADRPAAFMENVIAPRVGAEVGTSLMPLISVEANAGLAYHLYTGDDPKPDNDVFVDYGIRAFATPAAARIGLGYEGAAELTGEDGEEFGERSASQVGLWFDYGFGMLRPGVSFFIPMGDYGDLVDYTIGLSLEIDLPM